MKVRIMDFPLGWLPHPWAGAPGRLGWYVWNWDSGESKAWSCEAAGENEFRLWRIILSHSVIFHVPPTRKAPNQMESSIYSKFKPFLVAAQHPPISQTLHIVNPISSGLCKEPWPSVRTESSELWDPESNLSEVERSRKNPGFLWGHGLLRLKEA